MADTVTESKFRSDQKQGTPTLGILGTSAAAATTFAPVQYLTPVSGTTEITLITLPYTDFAGTIALLPLDNPCFTGATGGSATATNKPIGLAFTAVQKKILFLTYSPAAALWYPSYTS